VVAGTKNAVLMVESEAAELDEAHARHHAIARLLLIHDLDPNLGGDYKPSSQILAHCVKGRVLARRGRLQAV